MDDPTKSQFPPDLRCCRFCGELFGPIYGALKPYSSGLFSPSSVRMIADELAGDDSKAYFECYECEAQRRRKRLVFYSLLAALVLVALLFRYVSSGELRLPW